MWTPPSPSRVAAADAATGTVRCRLGVGHDAVPAVVLDNRVPRSPNEIVRPNRREEAGSIARRRWLSPVALVGVEVGRVDLSHGTWTGQGRTGREGLVPRSRLPARAAGHPRQAGRNEVQRRGSAPAGDHRLLSPRPVNTTLIPRLIAPTLVLIGRRPGSSSGRRPVWPEFSRGPWAAGSGCRASNRPGSGPGSPSHQRVWRLMRRPGACAGLRAPAGMAPGPANGSSPAGRPRALHSVA